jgi:hypothetical protein
MIKSVVAAAALTISLAGYAVAREAATHHHDQHHRHAIRVRPSPDIQPGPSLEAPDIYWSPAGGNPVHYAQTTGFYAGR